MNSSFSLEVRMLRPSYQSTPSFIYSCIEFLPFSKDALLLKLPLVLAATVIALLAW